MNKAGTDLVIEQVGYTHRDSLELTAQAQAHYRLIYGGPDSTPVDDDEFASPLGGFFVAYETGRPLGMGGAGRALGMGGAGRALGMGGWRFYRGPVDIPARRPAEIKRMYVVDSARGRGVARRLLACLEASAWAAGADAMVLETGRRQPAAIGLYRSSGYVDIPRFGHYADQPDAVHLGKLRSADSALKRTGNNVIL